MRRPIRSAMAIVLAAAGTTAPRKRSSNAISIPGLGVLSTQRSWYTMLVPKYVYAHRGRESLGPGRHPSKNAGSAPRSRSEGPGAAAGRAPFA